MSPGIWVIFIGTGLVTAFSPRPAVALAVARTRSLGPRAACISSAGNVVGVLVVGLLCGSALAPDGSVLSLLRPKSYVFFAAVLPQATAVPGVAIANLWPKVVAFAACTAASHAFYIGTCASLRISAAAALAIARICGAATAALGLGFVLADLTPRLSG